MEALKEIAVIISGFIALAIIAVLVSKNANTAGVISATATGVSTAIKAATGPVNSGFSLSGIGNNNF